MPPVDPSADANSVGAVVLCGGQSRRMGVPKSELMFGDETMLQRVVRLVATVFSPVVVVAAPKQSVVGLPDSIFLAHDQTSGCGPLAGIAAGFSALPTSVESTLVTACDLPLATTEFWQWFRDAFERQDRSASALMIRDEVRLHPIPAIVRREVLPTVHEMFANRELSLHQWAERIAAVPLRLETAEAERLGNPLHNVNDWEAYQFALRQ